MWKRKILSLSGESGQGNLAHTEKVAAELVKLNVDVIVTAGSRATGFAKEATVTMPIPVVMAQDGDPVANGLLPAFARPGGNITGLSVLTPELSGKRIEI